MATTPTLIGPVGTRQINSTLYVGRADLTTIQSAVSMAVKIGGLITVIIPFDYTGADAISAVTGGNGNIVINDLRNFRWQSYWWSGGQFISAAFLQKNGFMAEGMPLPTRASFGIGYDPTGTSNTGTAHLDVYSNPGTGMPSINIAAHPNDGTNPYTYCRFEFSPTGGIPAAGIPQLELPCQLGLFNDAFNHYNLWTGQDYVTGNKGMSIWARPTANAIDLQGQTIGGAYDQTIRLNYLGGSVQIGPIIFDAAGNIIGIDSLAVNSLTAGDAKFTTCEVANSPVRTFANTPDTAPGEGMIWPPIGIAVSTGTAWGTSINPASLATWPPIGIAVSTGTAWGTSINPASLATWPAAGVPVSTGTAWGTPIPSGDIARLSLANTFASNISVTGNLAVNGTSTLTDIRIGYRSGSSPWNVGSPNLNSDGLSLVINSGPNASGGALLLNWDQGTLVNFGNGAAASVGTIDSSGRASFTGVVSGASFQAGPVISSGVLAGSLGYTTNTVRVVSINPSSTVFTGSFTIIGYSSNYSASATYIACFQDAAGVHVNVTGNFTVNGAKNFRITHPLDETQWLTHSSLEGPEIAVFYRGEGVTAGGWAEITLPHYFEALTTQENRSVLLTALFEDDAEQVGMLAASRVKNGKLKVWSALPVQKFYWEVKAVRSDVSTLQVETEKADDPEFMRTPPTPPTGEKNDES